ACDRYATRSSSAATSSMCSRADRRTSNTAFFFQAEDGIRDGHVTGVQTCALPISMDCGGGGQQTAIAEYVDETGKELGIASARRSEERRVGKECRSRGSRDRYKKKCKQPDKGCRVET